MLCPYIPSPFSEVLIASPSRLVLIEVLHGGPWCARIRGNIAKQRAYEVKKSFRSQALRREKESVRKGKIDRAKTINFVFRDFNKDEQGLNPHIQGEGISAEFVFLV